MLEKTQSAKRAEPAVLVGVQTRMLRHRQAGKARAVRVQREHTLLGTGLLVTHATLTKDLAVFCLCSTHLSHYMR